MITNNNIDNVKYPLCFKGVISFNPPNLTNKHILQSNWKIVAIIKLDEDITKYYSWFIEKRYGIKLNKPLRETHLTVINDRIGDNKSLLCKYVKYRNIYQGKKINVFYNTDIKTDGKHWWLNAKCDTATIIRKKMGLNPSPFYDYHITIGRVGESIIIKNQSEYIFNLIRKFGKEYL